MLYDVSEFNEWNLRSCRLVRKGETLFLALPFLETRYDFKVLPTALSIGHVALTNIIYPQVTREEKD
jgi:hypothetical protein